MTDGKLQQLSIDFAIKTINYYKWLISEKHEHVMSKQILRSGTSIGANIHEAIYAVSRPDFISKMQIALKETSETEYWLIVLERTNHFDQKFDSMREDLLNIKRILIASLNTAKKI